MGLQIYKPETEAPEYYTVDNSDEIRDKAVQIAREILSEQGYREGRTLWSMKDITVLVFDSESQSELFLSLLSKLTNPNAIHAYELASLNELLKTVALPLATEIAEREANVSR